MDPYALHLAMAALVGASFVAVSAYYMHRKTLDQLLEFAKLVEKERDDESNTLHYNNIEKNRKKIANDRYRRSANSLPDVTAVHGDDVIPSGLPRLRTLPEEKAESGASKRTGHLHRPPSPKSPIASASALESGEGSEEDADVAEKANLDTTYFHTNGNDGCTDMNLSEQVIPNGEQLPIAASSMIRSHSVSGDLHGVQPDPVAADILRKEPEHETFVRLKISPSETPSADEAEVYRALQVCLEMRKSYVFRESIAPWEKEVISDPSTPKRNPNPFEYTPETKSNHYFQMEDGVVHVYAHKDSKEKLFPVADATTFFTDLHHILKIIAAGNTRTVCHHRLGLLEQKFNLHLMLNADKEFLAQKSAPHRDFYNVRKVDTHVHHSACMNQKHLLRFIKSKLRKEPDEVVIFRDGTYLTLKEVFESLDLTGYDLNVDLLDVHADKSTFHRFDKFNLKYNPCGQSRLREIFLKQDNLIQGRFLAELTKQVFADLDASKYQMAEYRISIYGRKQSEWDNLASWIVNNELYSDNVVWLIQLPRLYNIYKEMGIVTSFQTILDNVFLPLFEVTVDPESHPQLHVFLKQVVGLDLVDDESKPERRPTKHMPTPAQWTNIFNPAFSYYVYYCYANLYTLNKLRESKGMTTIRFRPHCGEAGDIDHLAASFLTTHNIAHGINLRKSPVLQYLYYLAQIGLAMSPLSNNSLFLDYHRNPFPLFFLRGLNVSLSTDDPLQIHLTKEPLVEEYSIAASVWKLSSCDLCEIARNSVYQSGFSHVLKSHWIGPQYFKRGPDGNDIHKTNVPHIRLEFRDMIWKEEMQQVYLGQARFPEYIET
ncbi:putative AMP deaminase [Helianthus annuus]|uniref:AMP deaminase n=1 Tax=Helianthus annuus TaxID=4232 RepID=A0A251SSL9_HELAN|nr:AMP deaminase [Helianthus annuus]KAF5773705.1 putative AMP deaminase [Helianthus annuus]KAJ0497997.1 putative AMP deaminase [Helianthus annuus]KAJ0671484.1 putative AMP deaminase [Helianthus annuus]KAJ0858551.1 putative AMP deaminase [Helianthus annuus]